MDCSRDRVHKPFNRDIEEGPFGAVSLCTSHLTANNDVDLGDSLTYTGGKYESGAQPDDPLVRSYRNQVPLRLVRSYNLTNEFAPKTGYRYDGLYTVAACWIGVGPESEENYKFALLRVRNQEPPAWRPAAGFSRTLVHPAKKYSGPRTRCNAERFSTNLCNDTHPTPSVHETAGSSRSRTDFAKYSLNKSSVSNGSDRNPPESKKVSHDSTIVTRCISSKKIECSSSTASSVSSVDSLMESATRHLESSSKPPPCKLQNTNISIRTDLYESYLHQDPVKATPMTFCRTFKTARGPSHIVKNVGTLNLNSCGPCPRDKEQESQIQSRSGVGKFLSTQSPSSESNRSADRGTPKIGRAVATPTEGKTSFDDQTGAIGDPIEDKSIDRPKSTSGERAKEKRLQEKRHEEDNSMRESANDSSNKSSDEADGKIERVCPIMRTTSKEVLEAAAMSRDETGAEATTKESHGAIDTLTPDQMLNFIVEQKCHPRAKLLIGSVIGLATGESTILRAYDSLISRQKRWDRSQASSGARIDPPADSKEQSSEPKFEHRQASSGPSQKNERGAPKGITKKIVMKERMLKMRLRHTRVSKRSLVKEKKKSIIKPSESMSQRLRKSKITDKSQQPFSKSTTLKTSAKRAKKRGGELARLVIDANIGPKIRGPRNRRLRGRTHIFSKMRRASGEQDVSKCCGGSSDVGPKGKKVNARVELSSRRSKRLTSAAKTRIAQSSRYNMERKKNVQDNETTPRSRYVERKKRERASESRNLERSYTNPGAAKLEARASNARAFPRAPSASQAKRKLPRTRSSSRDQASGESSKRSCYRSRDDSTNRRSRMVDAATQCSDRQDAATSVEREIGQEDRPEAHENSVKVEWIDLDDVKSETQESVGEEPSSDFDIDRFAGDTIDGSREDPETQTRPNNVLPIRPRATKPQINVAQRLSAFVPVNLSDSDFRIARLRSIGFRPIEPAVLPTEKDPLQVHADCDSNWAASGGSREPDNPTVVSRIVDEQYNKYTSEETDVVEYMDQELRYQDIEDEEAGGVRKNRGKMSKNGPRIGKNKKIEGAISKGSKIDDGKSRVSVSNEDDSEAPWHGWKKSVQNKQAHWTGW